MKISKKVLTSVAALSISTSAFAHFQMIHTEKSDITGMKKVPFELMFTHPADGVEAHNMNIGQDEKGVLHGMKDFYVVHKGKKKEASQYLKKSTFGEGKHEVSSFKFELDRKTGLRGGGDWGLVAVPAPYYEGSEGIYIQQITKTFVNKDDITTDWQDRIAEGYPEILPKSMPTNVWKGQVFTAQVVDTEGKPVSGAEVEIEYVNANVKNSNFVGANKTEKAAMVLLADDDGYFSFIPQEAGYWGFAALGAGGEKTYNGKELSLDAVLWIEAK
ncbi:DUF4198 domain-containing protein [Fusobacterium sp. MFO224]|uniref:DUF4198 domain-containing protein n=1 Tax=Fusobacterium sp. MFO224 TaxID=3378070 RepID=UPI003852B1EB